MSLFKLVGLAGLSLTSVPGAVDNRRCPWRCPDAARPAQPISSGQELGRVAADGAYDTRKCHDAIAARNAHGVMSSRKHAKLCKPDTSGPRARNEAVGSSQYLGRALGGTTWNITAAD